MKTSPLSEDSATVETWLKEQPNPEELFKRYTFDEMKSALEKWLSPEDAAEEGDIISEPATDFEDTKPASNFSLDTSKAKQSKTDEFDSLFEDKKESKVDDLPF